MEATISIKIIGKDELKGWMIAQTIKPLPEQHYRKLCFEFRNGRRPATALLEGCCHDTDWEWNNNESGSSTGGDNGGDYGDAFGGEELHFAIGKDSDYDTGRRPSRRQLGVAR